MRREGDDILEQARARAERMVQRTEVVKAAEKRAREIVEAADTEARRMRVQKLQEAVRAGLYYVPAKTVAKAILRRLGITDYVPAHQQR